MSLVICLSTAQFSFIAGDGMARDLDTGEIVSENYQKVYRINSNAIVGFSGTDLVCESALLTLPSNVESLSITEIADILCPATKKFHEETGQKGSMILTGIEDNKIVTISFGSRNDYRLTRCVPTGEQLIFDGLYPDSITSNIFYDCYKESPDIDLNSLIKKTFELPS